MNGNEQLLKEKAKLKKKLVEATNNVINIIKLFIQDDVVDEAIEASKKGYDACDKMISECDIDAIRIESHKIALSTDDHVEVTAYNAVVDGVDTDMDMTDEELRTLEEAAILIVNQSCNERDGELIPFAKAIHKARKKLEVLS